MAGGHIKIIKLKTIDSTHKFAVRLIENKKVIADAIVAENQTDGIGRCGRSWLSAKGNLFVSIIKKKQPSEDLNKLSLYVSCAIHEAILKYISSGLYLHWPNDIYHQKSKIAGILITVIDDWIVISFGVNINSTPDVEKATSLIEILAVDYVSQEEVLRSIFACLKKWHNGSCSSGFRRVKDYWVRYANEIGNEVTIKNGDTLLSGIFKGIDDFGRLILEKDNVDLFISSGDMFMNSNSITVNHE